MARRTDTLQVRLTSTGGSRVRAELDGVEKEMHGVAGAAGTLATEARAAASAIAIAATAAAAVIAPVIVRYERLDAQLRTATGSVQAAAQEFDALQRFANRLGLSVDQAVTAFVRLQNLGLTPSEAALESYANTAAASGKTIIDFVEAVADATTGEFERLREFGIKARVEGDKVGFQFQKTTTRVRNDAASIESYLRSIGEIQFAGAQAQQADTLGGAFARLQNAGEALAVALGEAGLTDVLKGLAQLGIDTAAGIRAIVDPTSDAAREAAKYSEAARTLLFTLILLKEEFTDLGDVIGANAAAFVETPFQESYIGRFIGQFVQSEEERLREQERYLSIINRRQERRAALEQRFTDIAGLLDGIGKGAPKPLVGASVPDKPGGGSTQPDAAATRAAAQRARSIATIVDRLRDEALTLGLAREQVVAYELAKLGATQATITEAAELARQIDITREAIRADEELKRSAERRRQSIDDIIQGLAEESRTIGLTRRELVNYELASLGATQADLEQANAKVSLIEAAERQQTEIERLADIHRQASDEIRNATDAWHGNFVRALQDSSYSMGDFATSVLQELERIALARATQPLFDSLFGLVDQFFNPFGGLVGSNFALGATGSLGNLPLSFSGRAGGGPVYAGQTYLIGERGPELLTMGATSGRVTPNGGGGNGAQTLRVQIVNDGAPKQVTQADARFDPSGAVVRLVVNDLTRQGGPISHAIERTYGLRRKPG